MEKKDINYEKLSQERVFCISDLITELVRKLIFLIIAAVIGAALYGGYKYKNDKADAEAAYKAAVEQTAEDKQADLAKAEDELTEEEKSELNNAKLVADNITQQQEYLNNSYMLQINAYKESYVTLQYMIDSPSDNETQNLEALDYYDNYVTSGTLAYDVAQLDPELDAQYVEELLSFVTSQSSNSTTQTEGSVNAKQPTFVVAIIHKDKESAEALSELVKQCMTAYQDSMDPDLGKSTITLVADEYSEWVDRSLITYKYDRTTSLANMQDKLTALENDMSDTQIALLNQYQALTNEEAAADTEDATVEVADPSSVSFSKKAIVLGGAAGFVLMALIIIIIYMYRGTIGNAEDIQYLYNLTIIGELNRKKNGVNNLLRHLSRNPLHRMSEKEHRELLLAKLSGLCKNREITRVLICEDLSSALSDTVKTWMQKEMQENGVEIAFEKTPAYSAAVLEKAVEYHNVVLVETENKSRYVDVVNTIKTCAEQDINILGIIALR